MTQILVFISGVHSFDARSGLRKSCLDYCGGAGLGMDLKSDCYSEEAVPGPVLAEVMSRAGPGAHFITNSLASFGVKPSEQRARIRALQAKDVTVHILGLGPVDNVMAILKACWDAAIPLEQQLEQLQADYDAHEAQLAERFERFESRLVARLSELKGAAAVHQYFGSNGSTPPEAAVTDETAIHIRQAREAKGWSQQQLSEAAGVSKSAIQRAETTGKSTELAKILSALEHDGWQAQAENEMGRG